MDADLDDARPPRLGQEARHLDARDLQDLGDLLMGQCVLVVESRDLAEQGVVLGFSSAQGVAPSASKEGIASGLRIGASPARQSSSSARRPASRISH